MHKNLIDLTGRTFGMYSVVSRADNINKRVHWNCVCECGVERVVISCNLTSGKSKSCGKHGGTHGNSKKPEWAVWYSMVRRCTVESALFYELYGGRGITVCDEWLEYDSFISDMKDRPSPKHQLDRTDSNKGYSADNCKWVLAVDNLRNRRDSKWWFVDGVKYESMRHAAKEIGVAHSTIKVWCNTGKKGSYSISKYGEAI